MLVSLIGIHKKNLKLRKFERNFNYLQLYRELKGNLIMGWLCWSKGGKIHIYVEYTRIRV